MKKSIVKYFACVIGIFSLIINILVIIPYADDYYNRYQRKKYKYFTKESSDKEVILKCRNYALSTDGNDYYNRMEYSDLLSDLKKYYLNTNSRSGVGFNVAYCYAGLSYYLLRVKDSCVLNYLINIADTYADENYRSLQYKVDNVNYAPFGLLYINLYRITRNPKYLNVAKALADDILELRTVDDIIPYHPDTDYYYTDCVGMLVPFMMEYYNVTGDTIAKNTAIANFYQTVKYAVDKETGIPCHGYDIKSHIKCGSSNWGRGIGWYLLAASFIPEFNDSILDSTLSKLDYTQFPGDQESHYDTSTALMFEIYKNRKSPHKALDISFLKTHITTDGMIMDCSGDTKGYNNYSFDFGGSELCLGLFFMLISQEI